MAVSGKRGWPVFRCMSERKCSQLRVKTLFMMRIICLTAESRTNLLNGRISGVYKLPNKKSTNSLTKNLQMA